jgi:raffinose/stachyose/melibiose transport system permease protein
VDGLQERDWMLLLAYWNSTLITVGAVTHLVLLGAMVGYVARRRQSR